MPETPQANTPEARTTEGAILDQSQTTQTTEPTPNADPNPPAEPQAAPSEYTPFTAPEGSALDPKAIEGATAIFRELGLSQSQAQKLVDWGANREKESTSKSAEAYNNTRTEWRNKTESDPIITSYEGGIDGVKADIGKAINTLPPKLQTELRDALTLTGAGDHPAVVKAFLAFAKSVNEGQHVSGSGPSEEGQTKSGAATRPSAAAAMFPNLPSSVTH